MEKEEYNLLEPKRRRALVIGDAETYSNLCDQLGLEKMDLEDPRLYDRGKQPELDFSGGNLEVSVIEEGPIVKPRKRVAKDKTYSNFLKMVENLHTNDYRGRRKAMFNCFGRRFGPEGVTPLARMSDDQVWKVCEGLKRYARQRLGND